MNSDFDWMRILLALGLMTLCLFVLPAYFLWRDKRVEERARTAEVSDDQDAKVGR